MTTKNEKNLVLRTVYLNPERDEELRKIAFENRLSKGDLIRRLIDFGLEHKLEFLKALAGDAVPAPKNTPDAVKDKVNKSMPTQLKQLISKAG
jgi:hypothetical protein